VTPSLATRFIAATGAAYAYARTILVRPGQPEPGYHLPHEPADVGGAVVLLMAGAALVFSTRQVLRKTFHL
jgi:hypothetical protein